MQKLYILILVAVFCVGPAFGRQRRLAGEVMLKARQREELQALKLKQKYARESLQNSRMPKAVRTELKHELKREQRKLRHKQKDQRQALKDRQKLLNLEMKDLGLQ